MVDDVMTFLRPEDHRNKVIAQEIADLLRPALAQPLALLFHFLHPHRDLCRAQDWQLEWVGERDSRARLAIKNSRVAWATGELNPLSRKIRYARVGFADFVEQLEPVLAQGFIVGVDSDLVEEGIDEWTQPRHMTHRAFEIFISMALTVAILLDDFIRKRFLFRLRQQLGVRRAGEALPVLLLFDAQDVRRAFNAGQEILCISVSRNCRALNAATIISRSSWPSSANTASTRS